MKLVLTYDNGAMDISTEVAHVEVRYIVDGAVGRTVEYRTPHAVNVVNEVIKAVLDGEVLFEPPQPVCTPPKGSLFDCVKTGKPFESATQTFKGTEYVYVPFEVVEVSEEYYDSLAELKEKYPEAIQARRYKKEYVKCSEFAPEMGDALRENVAATNEFDDYIDGFMDCEQDALNILNKRVEAVIDGWATEFNEHPRFFRLVEGELVSAIEMPFRKRWG